MKGGRNGRIDLSLRKPVVLKLSGYAHKTSKKKPKNPLVLNFPWTDEQRGFDLKWSNKSLAPDAQSLTFSNQDEKLSSLIFLMRSSCLRYRGGQLLTPHQTRYRPLPGGITANAITAAWRAILCLFPLTEVNHSMGSVFHMSDGHSGHCCSSIHVQRDHARHLLD